MDKLTDLEDRVVKIERRNRTVETDKAWETSATRRLFLILFTYLAIGLYMSAVNIVNPWLNAVAPSIGFLLSTLTLPIFKKIWEKNVKKTL